MRVDPIPPCVGHWSAAAALVVALILAPAALAQKASPARPVKPDHAQVTVPARTPGGDAGYEQQVSLAREEIEVLRAYLDLRKDLVKNGEMRLEQAKRWKTHFEVLLRDGKVTEDRVLSATDDVLMLEAHVASERAELRLSEVRLRQAQHRLDYGAFPITPENRIGDITRRLDSIEFSIDRLQHEVGRLRRDQPESKK